MTTSSDSVVFVTSLESTMTLDDCSGHTPPDSNSLDFALFLQSPILSLVTRRA